MANKTFNIYCDESRHLEHDHKPYMLLGNISSAYPQVKRHSERIKEIKKKHHFYAEIKWTNVSQSKLQFYIELIDYFFDTDLKFRAIGIHKEQFKLEAPNTQGGRIKMRSPPKVLTGNFRPSQLSFFLS